MPGPEQARVWTLNDAEHTRMLYPVAGPRPAYGEVVPVVEAQPVAELLERLTNDFWSGNPEFNSAVVEGRAMLASIRSRTGDG